MDLSPRNNPDPMMARAELDGACWGTRKAALRGYPVCLGWVRGGAHGGTKHFGAMPTNPTHTTTKKFAPR